jgi:hypothetical protein
VPVCQNWDISKSREIDTLADAASPERIAEAAGAFGRDSRPVRGRETSDAAA